jgi:hypothetical protein
MGRNVRLSHAVNVPAGADGEGHDMAERWQPRDREWQLSPYDTPPYREIETKIGEDLRLWYEPPQELPHRMLTLLIQLGGRSEGGDRAGYA